eukprot:3367817-Amphidinium_carterae.1
MHREDEAATTKTSESDLKTKLAAKLHASTVRKATPEFKSILLQAGLLTRVWRLSKAIQGAEIDGGAELHTETSTSRS